LTRLAWGFAVAIGLLDLRVAHAGPDAEVTSAADPDDKFDLHVTLDYEYTLRRSTIERERVGEGSAHVGDPIPLSKELTFSSSRHTITPRLELGIFHDLSLSIAMPIVVLETRELDLDQRDTPCTFSPDPNTVCVDRDNSTTIRDGLLPANGFDARDPATSFPGDEAEIFRGVDRKGLDQVHLGITWAPMNQARDDTKPTWKLSAEVRLPIGKVATFDRADPGASTGVGRGVDELRLSTTVDKRIGWAEPYWEAWWMAPVAVKTESPYQNPGFGSKFTSEQQQAGTRFGFEAIAVDRGPDKQRVSLDLSANLIEHFQGRGYSEMWEVFAYAGDTESNGPLVLDSDPTAPGVQALSHPGVSNIENYLEGGAQAALRVDLGPLVHIAALGEVTRETTHLISFADAGRDRPTCKSGQNEGTSCETSGNEVVDPGTVEVNPLHAALIDQIGHRFLSQGAVNIRVGVEARILF
jgi:hypothetical protein